MSTILLEPNPASGYDALILAAANEITISSPDGALLPFTAQTTGDYKVEITLDSPATDSGTYIVTFSDYALGFCDLSSGNCYYITGGQLVYTIGSGGQPSVTRPNAPALSQSSCDFWETFELSIIDPNDPAGTIRYTVDGTEPSATNGMDYTGPIQVLAGNDLTVKAVVIRDGEASKVVTGTYHYIVKSNLIFSFTGANSAFTYTNVNAGNGYGEFRNGSVYQVTEGTQVYIQYHLADGYRVNSITMDGVARSVSSNFNFTMPANDVVLEFNTVFDPANPGDPEGGEPARKYALKVVSNPVGAVSVYGTGSYEADESVQVRFSTPGNDYVFTGWTMDGQTVSTSVYYTLTMPAHDAVITANFVFNPDSPDDPSQPALQRPLTVVASPSGAASFSTPGSQVIEGETYTVRATPKANYVITGWLINGVDQKTTTRNLTAVMTAEGAQIVCQLAFSPANPGNPGANYWNPQTGQMIVDDFQPGSLFSTIDALLNGASYSAINHLIVKGVINTYDAYDMSYLTNASTIDLSRTNGLTSAMSYMFQNCAASRIVLPASITKMESSVFSNCSQLASLTCYATVPPAASSSTFSSFSNQGNCTLYVPEESVPLYEQADYWKDFAAILPITDDAHVLQVNLPADCTDGRYKNNIIELVNTNTAARQRYVVTDRLLYTFNGLQKDEQYNVYLMSQAGLEIGVIEGILVPDQDFEVTFSDLSTMRSISAKVLDGEGNDVTEQVTVEWLKPLADGTSTYLRKTRTLGEVPIGQDLICRITLPQRLGTVYEKPADLALTVDDATEAALFNLQPLPMLILSGTVLNSDGEPVSNGAVAITQLIDGRFHKNFTARTDASGAWSAQVMRVAPIRLTYSASECIPRTDNIAEIDATLTELALEPVTLSSKVGARIRYTLNYHEAGQSESSIYEDFNNVTFKVRNITRSKDQDNISNKYPELLVLDETLQPGDMLEITAISTNDAFQPVSVSATVVENAVMEATFELIGLGGIHASFEMTENPSVVGMLYNTEGLLKSKGVYKEADLRFTSLPDGQYTLISMGESNVLNSVLRLSNYAEMGMEAGKDYDLRQVTVVSGQISEVEIPQVPVIDTDLFTYTNQSYITFNKASVTTGKSLTCSAALNFKPVYKNKVSDVTLVIDIPDECQMVKNSLIQGTKLLPYNLENGRLTVALGSNYATQVRFCVIPLQGGDLNLTGAVKFTCDGRQLSQPIGTAYSKIKDLEIVIPSTIAQPTFMANGTGLADSDVNIYNDNELIGSGKVNRAGYWSVECTLSNPANLSDHPVHAELITPDGMHLISETSTVSFDSEAAYVTMVRLYDYGVEKAHYDFRNPHSTPQKWSLSGHQLTYTLEFSENDPDLYSYIVLYIHQADGSITPLIPTFDQTRQLWVADFDLDKYGGNSAYPVNVSVDFETVRPVKMDAANYNGIFDTYTEFSASVADIITSLTPLEEQISALMIADDLDTETLDDLFNQYYAASGEDFEAYPGTIYTEENIQELFDAIHASSAELALPDQIGFLNQSLEEISQQMEGVTVTGCDGLDEAALLDAGYQTTVMTDGNKLYTLATETEFITVDLTNNRKVVIDLTSDGQMAQIIRAAKDDKDFPARMTEFLEKMGDGLDKMKAFVSEIAGLIDNLESIYKHHMPDVIARLKGLHMSLREGHLPVPIRTMMQAEKATLTVQFHFLKGLKNFLKSDIVKNLKVGRMAGPFAVFDIVQCGIGLRTDFRKVIDLYNSIPNPCKDDQAAADRLRGLVVAEGVACGVYYVSTILADVAQLAEIVGALTAAVPTGGTSLVAVAGAVALGAANFAAGIAYSMNFDKSLNALSSAIRDLECLKGCGKPGGPKCPPTFGDGGTWSPSDGDDSDPTGGKHHPGNPGDDVSIDPSGYVYEAVPSNRVEGVQATIYYKETYEDMYGDPYEREVLWNAEEYAQENPLFTDENGMYQWDVPQGLWQVRFEKDGYIATKSEWLPVPPPQLDVNIAIQQNRQPAVTEARAYEEGVEVQFDKYMDPETLTTANIFVTAGGQKVEGELTMLDGEVADPYLTEEQQDGAQRYVSRVRFVPAESLSMTTGKVHIFVNRNVLSYAGIPMTENFSQELDIEKEVQAITADDTKVLYGADKQITVFAIPFDASAGRVLKVQNGSEMIATVDATEFTLDEEGKAVITVHGALPGQTLLTFSIDDVTVTGECTIDVKREIITPDAPVASRASGTAVYRGSKLVLTTDSKDGVIYFTTDGSCPCDENGTRRKYSVPLVINEDMHIKAMTSVGDGADDVSETVEFNYTLKRSDMDFNLAEGWTWISHSFESPITPAQLAEGNQSVTRVLSQSQEAVRDPEFGMFGTLSELTAESLYKVKADATTPLDRLSDVAWNPATPIALSQGWNWLGYPVGQTMTVDEALATTGAEQGDYIVGQNGFATFDGTAWTGTLETMSPGMGYMYQSASVKDVVYNTSIVSNAAAQYIQGITDTRGLVVDIHRYASIMPMIATVQTLDGTDLENEQYLVAAFCGTECRGIGKLVDGLVMMNIYGDPADDISLQAVCLTDDMTYVAPQTLAFSETVVGDLQDPYPVRINTSSGIQGATYEGNVKVFVEGDMLRIRGIEAADIQLLQIYDLNGARLVSTDTVSESGLRISNLVKGVYVVIVNGNGQYTYHKIAL